MEPQAVVAAALAYVRLMKKSVGTPDLQLLIAHAAGIVAGLEAAGTLSASEASYWKRRIDAIDHPGGAVTSPATDAPVAKHLARDTDERNLLRHPTRVVEGRFDAALFDGGLRITSVELFEDRARVHWLIAPMPSVERILGHEDLIALNQDLEGLDPSTQDTQRRDAALLALYSDAMVLSDDVGSTYEAGRVGGGGSNSDGDWGIREFVPAVPAKANRLYVAFHDARIVIPLE